MSVRAYAHQFATRMFVATADQDYILARSAFFKEFDLNFFWLSLHALEKYFKAVLLMNDRSTKQFAHDLVKLHTAVLALDTKLDFGPLVRPAIEGLDHWREETIDSYLARLNEVGSPDNRYSTYGYSLHPEDLFKVDQLVWAVRRHCRRLREEVTGLKGDRIEIDYVNWLRENPRQWTIRQTPLQQLMGVSAEDSGRAEFLHLNVPFAPDVAHVMHGWRAAGTNSPFADPLMLLNAADASPDTREGVAAALTWAADHIRLSKRDDCYLREQLTRYAAEKTPKAS